MRINSYDLEVRSPPFLSTQCCAMIWSTNLVIVGDIHHHLLLSTWAWVGVWHFLSLLSCTATFREKYFSTGLPVFLFCFFKISHTNYHISSYAMHNIHSNCQCNGTYTPDHCNFYSPKPFWCLGIVNWKFCDKDCVATKQRKPILWRKFINLLLYMVFWLVYSFDWDSILVFLAYLFYWDGVLLWIGW